MKIGKINRLKASNYHGAIFVSLILVLSVITFATPTLSENLAPKWIQGYVSRCDSGSAAGASVLVQSSVGSRSTSIDVSNYYKVDVGPESGTEWPDSTSFTVTVTMSGWSGNGGGTVSGGLTTVATIGLNPTSSPSATAGANPTTVLVGSPVSFSGSGSGGASPYTYSWDFNGESSSSSQNPSYSFGSTGSKNCILTVTDACGTPATDSVTVQVNPALSAEAGGPYSGDVCDPVSFSGSGIGGIPPYSYSWAFGDSGSSSGASPSHQYTSDGGYTATITVTDSDSPSNSAIDTAGVTISTSTLVANAGGSYSGDVCSAVSFSGSATGGCTPYTYSWSFSDGGSASGQNPTHLFSSDGSYSATVTVTSADGQSDPDTASVSISTSTL